jgi:hypothetical protein
MMVLNVDSHCGRIVAGLERKFGGGELDSRIEDWRIED